MSNTHLDSSQVLKKVFDPDSGALRTTGTGGGSSTQISDSLGNVASITEVGSKKGLDVNVVNITIDLTDKISVFDLYNLNNLEEGSDMYIGYSKLTGEWLLKKFSDSSGSMLYANNSNNPTFTLYSYAWGAKESLNYNPFHEILDI